MPQYGFPVQLRGSAQVIVGQWHIRCFADLNCKGDTDNSGLHIVQAGGFGIKGEQISRFQSL